jgi:hypothetical protein
MTVKTTEMLRHAKCFQCNWRHCGTGAEVAARRHTMRTEHTTSVMIEKLLDFESDASSELVKFSKGLRT